ncbi:MAG: DMT family transporter [Oscillospiraceae bacterium]|nr:DMT family transporter [Oscillospiraceae bacterium]
MTKSRKDNFIGSLILALTALIWGSSFVAQTTGAEHVGPFTFIAMRSLLGAAFLLPVIAVMQTVKRVKSPEQKQKMTKEDKKYLLIGGSVCGVVLCVASCLQQLGIDRGTQPGMAAFITALYILLVPIFSVVIGKKIRPVIWGCVAVSVVALYLLCVKQGNHIQSSDLFVLACAVCYAIHILVIDKVSPKVDGVMLSAVQFLVAGILAGLVMLLTEEVSAENLRLAAPSIAYSGIMSSGVAYTLQIIGQQKTEPTLATMIMSLESVFGVLTAMVVLSQVPTPRETAGCILMFLAIIVAQLPEKKGKNFTANQRKAKQRN